MEYNEITVQADCAAGSARARMQARAVCGEEWEKT